MKKKSMSAWTQAVQGSAIRISCPCMKPVDSKNSILVCTSHSADPAQGVSKQLHE